MTRSKVNIDAILEAVKEVYDPEIPVNIYDLGLIYSLEVDEKTGKVRVDMTLTSPACPVAESMPLEVQEKILEIEGVKEVDLRVVFDPPWNKDKMSEEARFALDMF
jgi:FeS assembly SUF system protein